MSNSEQALEEYASKMDEVMVLYFKDYRLTEIARRTGLKRVEVQRYIDDFQHYAVNNGVLTERAADAIAKADKHYGEIISQAHDVAERAQEDDEKKVEISALTLAASTEEKRVRMFKESGVMENLELAKQNAEMEEKVEAISQMLLSIAKDHPEVKDRITRDLSKIMNRAYPLTVQQELVPKNE